MDTNFLIIGDDGYIREKETEKLKNKFLMPDEISLNFSMHFPQSIPEMVNALETTPFLGNNRVAVLKQLDLLTVELADPLIEYLKKPSGANVLIIQAEGGFKKNKSYSSISGHVKIINADKPGKGTMKNWINTFFAKEEIMIAQEAVDLIVELKGDDTLGIRTELEKIASYSGGNKVEASDVEDIVGRSVTESVFKLVDAVNAKDAGWAYRIINDLYEQKKQPTEIIGYLGWYMRVIRHIKVGVSNGRSINEIATQLGYSAGYIRRLQGQAGKYTSKKINQWLCLLLESDQDIKTGRKPASLALDMLISSVIGSA